MKTVELTDKEIEHAKTAITAFHQWVPRSDKTWETLLEVLNKLDSCTCQEEVEQIAKKRRVKSLPLTSEVASDIL